MYNTWLLIFCRGGMNKNAERYYQRALAFFMPAFIRPEIDGFEIKLGKKHYYFRGSNVPFNDSVSAELARNKYCMNKLLAQAGLPVPKAAAIHMTELNDEQIAEKLTELTFPLVIKPTLESSKGRGVLCNIQTFAELKKHLVQALQCDEFVTIEEFHGNLNSYRVLIFFGKVIGVVRRHAAHVVGDGEHTVQELIDSANVKRTATNEILGPILIDDEAKIRLTELGLQPNHILEKDQRVTLCYTCNSTRGGTYESFGKAICKENANLLIRAASVLGLNFVGFDIECPDILVPMITSGGVIIEANQGASIRIHEEAINGASVFVTKKIISALIYRHPFAYLYSFLTHPKIRPFVSLSLIFISLMSLKKLVL